MSSSPIGSLLGLLGGVGGSMFGGPLGGMAGGALGNMFGGLLGGGGQDQQSQQGGGLPPVQGSPVHAAAAPGQTPGADPIAMLLQSILGGGR